VRSFGELGVVVVVPSLAHAIYSLFKSSGNGEPSMTRTDLRQLRDMNFAWLTEHLLRRSPSYPRT
jgi:hypothetical protein